MRAKVAANQPLHLTRRHFGFSGFNVSPAAAQVNGVVRGWVLNMTTEIWQHNRPKGRKPVWAFRVKDGPRVVFESRLVSIRLLSSDAASWIASLIDAIRGEGSKLEWRGDLQDDCLAEWSRFGAHAEHLHGPRNGGNWYCSVYSRDGQRFFHTADRDDVRPKSGPAARWLCELVISAAEAGIVAPYVA